MAGDHGAAENDRRGGGQDIAQRFSSGETRATAPAGMTMPKDRTRQAKAHPAAAISAVLPAGTPSWAIRGQSDMPRSSQGGSDQSRAP